MAHSIRSRRTAIAAGVLSVALVAPFAPGVGEVVLPAAVAQTADDFNETYETENFEGARKGVAVQGLTLDDGTTVAPTTDTIFNWHFRNDGGTLIAIPPTSTTVTFKDGQTLTIPIRVTPSGGKAYTANLKLKIVDSWTDQIEGFDTRHDVDFTASKSQNVEGTKVPADATVAKDGIGNVGWSVSNEGGVVRVTAPANFTGVSDVDIPVTISKGGTPEKRTLKLAATGPEKPSIGNTLVNGIGSILGQVVGNLKLPPLVDAKVDVHDNPISVTDNIKDIGNDAKVEVSAPVSIPVDIHDNVKDNVKDNFRDNEANATADVEIRDNFRDNVRDNTAEANATAHVEVKDNVRDNEARADVSAPVSVPVNVPVEIPVNIPVDGKVDVRDNGINLPGSSRGGAAEAGEGALAGSAALNDPRCVAGAVGGSIPLLLAIPVALASAVAVPGLEPVRAALYNAARGAAPSLGMTPEQLMGAIGGVAGVVGVVSALAGLLSCITAVEQAVEDKVNTPGTETKPAAEPAPAEPAA